MKYLYLGDRVAVAIVLLMKRAGLVLILARLFESPGFSQVPVDVLTWHNDLAHTGQNLLEQKLTLANVNTNTFGQWFSYSVDGFVYAQPLIMNGVNVPGRGLRNLVFVATEHDSVYAFDADNAQTDEFQPVWQVNFLDPTRGISTVPTSDASLSEPTELGITGTPVIDPDSGTLYVVVHTKEVTDGVTKYPQRLHALDVATGQEKFGGPVLFSPISLGNGNNSNGQGGVVFDDLHEFERCGLLLLNGIVYAAFASAGDVGPYHGWVLGFDAHTLQLVQNFNDTPNGYQGGIWMSGAGPSADAEGNLYLISGNGDFNPGLSDYGDSFMKLTPTGTNLVVTDYFAPYNQDILNVEDGDLGAGGAMLLPDAVGSEQHPHLLVGCGKEGSIYLIDRDNMGHFNPTDNSQIVQFLKLVIHGTWGNPAYYNGWVYYQGASDTLKAFSISNATMSIAPVSQNTASVWSYPGGTPSVSANETNNAIIWLLQTDTFYQSAPAILHAYNATNLEEELYNSSQAGGRDQPGLAQKFSVPVIANGKVFVQGGYLLSIYGNLGPPSVLSETQSQAVTPGTSMTLSVRVSGPPIISYQWQLNGLTIPEATNTTLVLTNLTLDQSGSYSIIVGNLYGSATNAVGDVVVADPPSLSIDTDFQLVLTGTGNVTYEIQFLDQANGSATWQALTQITLASDNSSPDPAQASFSDPAHPNGQRFYRAVVLPIASAGEP